MRTVYISLLVFAVLAGLFMGYYIWGPTWQIPKQFKYDILKDVLTIVLAVIALGIAALGFLVFRVVSDMVIRQTGERIMTEARRSIARLATDVGYSFGQFDFLDEAIRLFKEADKDYAGRLDRKDPENEELIGSIRNNLAYYLAKRGLSKDRDDAREYAKWIHVRSKKFPQHQADWEDTYNFVMQVYPDQQ